MNFQFQNSKLYVESQCFPLRLSGKQNLLFPSGPVIKCLLSSSTNHASKTINKMVCNKTRSASSLASIQWPGHLAQIYKIACCKSSQKYKCDVKRRIKYFMCLNVKRCCLVLVTTRVGTIEMCCRDLKKYLQVSNSGSENDYVSGLQQFLRIFISDQALSTST